MMNLREGFRRLASAFILAFLSAVLAQGASNIAGSVVNQSRGEPAAGDEVVLVRLDQGIEQARVKTDAHGVFSLAVGDSDRSYLVRVYHQGVRYEEQAGVGDRLLIQVFDTSLSVRDVTGSIEILRAGSNGNLLHVSDMYEVRNESKPPLTKVGARTFEVYLPVHAKIESVLAASPGKTAMLIAAAAVWGESGHYVVNFPLRPGATKFAFNYDLPYDGHAAFRTRHRYPLEQFAIMIPPTMKFSSPSAAFQNLAVDTSRYQVRAANHLPAGEGPRFEVSGMGELPSLRNRPSPPALPRPLSPSDRALGQTSMPAPPPSESLALGAVTSFLLAVCAVLLWRARRGRIV